MLKENFHEKITLLLSFFIISNYFFLNFNSPILLVKLNFLMFFIILFIFYFKNIFDNPFLKFFF